jgi:hypothetical protein
VTGYLIFKSSYFPKAIGILYLLPGMSYLINGFGLILAPAYADRIFGIIAGPAFVGEASFCLWLLVKGVNTECAADADALGFMAKMLVQTTLPHRAQPGKQYTRSDGDVTLSVTDLGGAGLPYGAYPKQR